MPRAGPVSARARLRISRITIILKGKHALWRRSMPPKGRAQFGHGPRQTDHTLLAKLSRWRLSPSIEKRTERIAGLRFIVAFDRQYSNLRGKYHPGRVTGLHASVARGWRMSRITRQVLILLLPFLLSLSGTAVRAGPIELTVMTQNLYVGADSDPLLKAPDQATAVAAATAAFQQVLANNFPARAAAIAGEIQAAGGPLLIGLQEAALISGPGTPPLD